MPAKLEHDTLIRLLREMRLPVMVDELDRLLNSNQLEKMNALEIIQHFIDEE